VFHDKGQIDIIASIYGRLPSNYNANTIIYIKIYHSRINRGALQLPGSDPAYVKRVRGYFDKFFGEIGKTEAYKTVMKLQSYSGYVAFLDTFPKSEKRNDVVNELKAFRIHIVDTNSREWISKQDMINSFGCQDTARLYKWSDEMAGSVRA